MARLKCGKTTTFDGSFLDWWFLVAKIKSGVFYNVGPLRKNNKEPTFSTQHFWKRKKTRVFLFSVAALTCSVNVGTYELSQLLPLSWIFFFRRTSGSLGIAKTSGTLRVDRQITIPESSKGSPFVHKRESLHANTFCLMLKRRAPSSILKVPNEQMEKSDREQLKVTVFLFGGLSRGKLWQVFGLQTLQELEGLIHETNVMKGQHDIKVKWNSLYHTKVNLVNLNIQWIRDTRHNDVLELLHLPYLRTNVFSKQSRIIPQVDVKRRMEHKSCGKLPIQLRSTFNNRFCGEHVSTIYPSPRKTPSNRM